MSDIVERLHEQRASDHVKGCDGRCYACSCGYDAATDALLKEAAAEIERLRTLVKDLADDLAAALRGHYGPVMDYPSEQRRFERDMANVYEARRALEGK
jgi:hypothetical protein